MYGDSRALSSDSMPIFPSNSNPISEEVFHNKNRELQFLFMESDSNKDYTHQLSGNNSNYGLLRYGSAPTSLLTNLTNNTIGAEKSDERLSNSRFCSDEENIVHMMENFDESNCSSNNRFAQLQPQYPRQNWGVSPTGMDQQGKIGSNLMRQNSSPAGLFSHLTSQNEYNGARGNIGYRSMADTCSANNGGLSPSSTRLMKNYMNYSPATPSSLGILSRISEIDNENGREPDEDSGFPFSSWKDKSTYFDENFIKREVDNDQKLFVNVQNGEPGNRGHTLSRHLSLPKISAEMAAVDKVLQIQDTVPCKIRAKRGCATHPRSIAERVRRTRISERMRKLQDLVPYMDKQTNTADMLDLAVEYMQSLQKQYKVLSDNRANCKCSASQVVLDQTHR